MINTIRKTENKIICSYCKSEHIKKDGKRKTKNRDLIQRYKCLDCKKRFILNDGFYRMRNSAGKITLCLDLFYRGVSTRKIQEHLNAFYPHNSSWVSIYEWIIKYSKQISKFTNNLKLNIGEEIQVDEIEYHRRKSHKAKKGIEENWFIDSICPETKFMVASEYGKSRGHKETKQVILRAKSRSINQIKIVTTDGLNAYDKVIKKVFGYNKKLKQYNVIHNKNISSKDEGFNYPIERLHNNIRQRTKVFRGFHGSIESANAIMKGWEIYYNFITKHQGIECCPYELATDLKLNSNNKWLELIYLSKK